MKSNKKNKQILKNILGQHVIGKDNLNRYNNGLFEKITAKLNAKLDKVNSTDPFERAYIINPDGSQSILQIAKGSALSNSIARRNEAGQIIANRPTQDNHLATKQYVDEQIIAPGFVTKEYVDKQDEAVYQNAQKYTDNEIAKQKQYIDTQDAENLKDAKEFADTRATESVQQAKAYTDTEVNKIDEKKLDKVNTLEDWYDSVYAIKNNGQGGTSQFVMKTGTGTDNVDLPGSLVRRDTENGHIHANYIPTENNDVANKKYVDDQIIEGHGKVEVGRWVILGESVKDLDPLEIFGYGIWSDVAEKYGEGALRVALNNYDIIGSDTHTQTENELASHEHVVNAKYHWGYKLNDATGNWGVVDYEGETIQQQVYTFGTGASSPFSTIQKSLNIRVLEREE